MSPTARRRILLCSLVALCAINLGCAELTNDPGWETQPSHPPLPAYFIDTTAERLQLLCPPQHRGWTTHGCAFRYYAINRCNIYVESGTPHWLAGHELEHCAGFDHKD